MTDQPLATLRDIATKLQLPESTVRYYRDAFAHHVPTVGSGRRRRYPPEAVAMLRLIAVLYQEGRSRDQVEYELSQLDAPEPRQRPLRVSDIMHRQEIRRPPAAAGARLAEPLEGERERRDQLARLRRSKLEIERHAAEAEAEERAAGLRAEDPGTRRSMLGRLLSRDE